MTNPFSLGGKTVLVTGASSGIGQQTCASISAMGGRVVAVGRDAERLEATLQMLHGDGHAGFRADLTVPEERAALVESAPRVNGVLHSAGITKHMPVAFLSEKHLREIHAINYEAPILLTQMLLKNRKLSDGGSIVLVASTAGISGLKAMTAYSGSKGALMASARVLALELAPRKIRVNCLAPAMVETPMAVETEDVVSSESMAEHRKLYPLGFGKPEDVANAALFLLSDASRWITGTSLVLDGGYTCQ